MMSAMPSQACYPRRNAAVLKASSCVRRLRTPAHLDNEVNIAERVVVGDRSVGLHYVAAVRASCLQNDVLAHGQAQRLPLMRQCKPVRGSGSMSGRSKAHKGVPAHLLVHT